MFHGRSFLFALRTKLTSRKMFRRKLREVVARNRVRPRFEMLEDRRVLATFVVTTTNDSGVGSLRDAIASANASPGADIIDFNIGGGGPQTIAPLTAYETITGAVQIRGQTQPGWTGTPLIEIRGDSVTVGNPTSQKTGLTIGASGTVVQQLAINRFANEGIWIAAPNVSVLQNYIGTDLGGTLDRGNIGDGIFTTLGASGCRIIGNLVSGNDATGVLLESDANIVQGNKIGTDFTGNTDLGNSLFGVFMYVGSSNIVGVDGDGVGDASEGNLISGNDGDGVHFQGDSNNNIVAGNLIGTNLAGTGPIGNGNGIGAQNDFLGDANRIGTDANGVSDDLERNVISGNLSYGVVDYGVGTKIAGNYVGTKIDGLSSLPNLVGGVTLGSSNATVGGTTVASRNIISGNSGFGVSISTNFGVGNKVLGNFIGVDKNGVLAVPNNTNGIQIQTGANNNTIGGTVNGARNIISGNTAYGVLVEDSGSSANRVYGNYIGVGVDGSTDVGNNVGVEVRNGATGNFLGGGISGAGNVIAGNTGDVSLVAADQNKVQGNRISVTAGETAVIAPSFGYSVYLGAAASKNVIGTDSDGLTDDTEGNIIGYSSTASILVQNNSGASDRTVIAGNRIGLASNGTTLLNTGGIRGIWLQGATNTRIGSDADGVNDEHEGNVIVNPNNGNSILLTDGTDATRIGGNYLGTNAAGTIGLATGGIGILVQSTTTPVTNTIIGGTLEASRNVISSMNLGIVLSGAAASGTAVLGNHIGTDKDGKVAIGNTTGLTIQSGASNIVVGGSAIGAGNIISGNSGNGVEISGVGTSTIALQGNFIGTSDNGASALGNGLDGIHIDASVATVSIGGATEAFRNIISGNLGNGVYIGPSVTNIAIQGNFIGVDKSGTSNLGNAKDGIQTASAVQIGGPTLTPGEGVGNVISGNGNNALNNFGNIYNGGAAGVVVQGNIVGLDKDGTKVIRQTTQYGVWSFQANGITIGGPATNTRNIISGNGTGILLQGGSGHFIQNNFIGTDLTGDLDKGNSAFGITTDASNSVFRSNVISGNDGIGFAISASSTTPTTIQIAGNIVGLNATGTAKLGNSDHGLSILGADQVVIGGTTVNDRNVFSGNLGSGIHIAGGAATTNTQIQGNYVGLGGDGKTPLGNSVAGVQVDAGVVGTQIGGTVPGASNFIGGNGQFGVLLNGAASTQVLGNFIGTDADEQMNFGNGIGVQIANSSTNILGGLAAGQANVIAFSQGAGIVLPDTSAASSLVRGNRVYSNHGLAIDVGPAGATSNGTAGYRDKPVFTSANVIGSSLVLTGTSQPNAVIDLYASTATFDGIGQGRKLLISLTEGLASGATPDSNAAAGAFTFTIPLGLLPQAVQVGSLLAAVSIGSTSEFSLNRIVGDPASSIAPIVDIGADQALPADLLFEREGTFTDPDSLGPWTVFVNYGDGTPEESLAYSATPTKTNASTGGFGDASTGYDTVYRFQLRHQYATQGSNVVTVRVVDNTNAVGTDSTLLTGTNQAPEFGENLLVLSPPRVKEGEVVTLTGRFTDTSLVDTHTISVDWGDGSTSPGVINPTTRTFSATHRYIDDGLSNAPEHAYAIQATLIDNLGAIDKTTYGLVFARVVNVLPYQFALTLQNSTITENGTASLSGAFLEPGVLDTHEVSIDWGDGSSPSTLSLAAGVLGFSGVIHQYLNDPSSGPDKYTITAKIVDDDEPQTPVLASIDIGVNNAAPSNLTTSLNAATINEGSQALLSGSFAEVGSLDGHSLTIDWGDGTAATEKELSAGVLSFSGIAHTYLDDSHSLPSGQYTIQISLKDHDGGSTTSSLPITVLNVAPTVSGIAVTSNNVPVSGPVTEGTKLKVTGSYFDVGVIDQQLIRVYWGDGTNTLATLDTKLKKFSATHTLVDDRPASLPSIDDNIVVVIDDQDLGVSTSTVPQVVSNVAPEASILPDLGSSLTLLNFVASSNDAGSADVPTLIYNWSVSLAPGSTGNAPTFTTSGSQNEKVQINRNGNLFANYVISLTVTDDEATSFSTTTTVIVLDNTPNIFDGTITPQPVGTDSATILGLDGNDTIDVHTWTIPVILDGGASDDVLIGSKKKDKIFLHQGNDTGNGMEDDDEFLMTFNSTLTVSDNLGANILNFSPTDFAGTVGVTFDLDKAISDPADKQDVYPSSPGLHFAMINGTFGQMIGTVDNDNLTIASGVTVSAGSGADKIMIGAGRTITGTTIEGGADNDIFQNDGIATGLVDFQGDFGADTFTNSIGATLGNVNFGGGADNDIFQNFGVVNGTVNYGGGADTDVFSNAGLIGGLVDFQGDFGQDKFYNEKNSTIANVKFGGGADNDAFTNLGSITGLVDFQGDYGVDTFVNDLTGSLGTISFGGGADNDVFQNFGAVSGLVDFQGDFGADTFTNEIGGALGNINFGGGADNDVFTNFGTSIGLVDFNGDFGEDRLINDKLGKLKDVRFTGGSDNDVFQNFGAVGGNVDFQGDAGADTFVNYGPVTGTINMGGGADNDIFQNFGAVGGKVDFQGDFGIDTFINDLGGSLTIVNMGGGADNDVFQNYGAVTGQIDFQGDSGRDRFVNQESGTTGLAGTPSIVNVRGNGDNDVFVNLGVMISSVNFGGGADNDIFLNYGAVTGKVDFQGDIGADTFRNEIGGTLGQINMGGGADNDVFLNFGAVTGAVDFQGDIGSDTFVNSGTIAGIVEMGGGADNDVFMNLGTLGSVNMGGGADNDIFANAGLVKGLVDFQGDFGIDTFVNADIGVVGQVNMGGGADDDYLISYGRLGSVRFIGGTGSDTMLADGVVEAAIYFDGEAGRDVLIDSGTGWLVAGVPTTTITFLGREDIDALQNNAANILKIDMQGDDGDDVLQNNGTSVREIRFNAGLGDDTFENNASEVAGIHFIAGSGNDRLFNDGSNVAGIEFIGSDGIDALLNTGSFVSAITMNGDADQDFFVSSGTNVSGLTFNGGAGNDEVHNFGAKLTNATFNGDDGNDLFRNRKGADGSSGITFSGFAGSDTFVNEAFNASQVTVNGGADNDVFYNLGLSATNFSFNGDQGDDLFQNQADDFAATTSTTVPGMNFVGGLGDDRFIHRGDRYGWLWLDGGDGSDSMNVGGAIGEQVTFVAGADDDSLVVYGSSLKKIDYVGDVGNDSLTSFVDSLVVAKFQGGAGDDKFDNRGNDAGLLDFDGGDGADYLSNKGARTGKIKLVGGKGTDSVLNTGLDTLVTDFDGGDDADSLNSLGSGYGSILYAGGLGDDTLVVDGTGRAGATIVAGMGAGGDVVALKGSNVNATINSDAGNDRFHLFAAGQLTLNGGTGDDEYYFIGNPQAQVSITEPANADRDLLSFASFTGGGVTLDLAINTAQNLSATSLLSLTLADNTTGFEDVIGSPAADTIYGNARDNKLLGAEPAPLPAATNAGATGRTQWVLLDFDSDTTSGEHLYTQAERNEIQRRIETSYWGPGGASDPWFKVFFVQSVSNLPTGVGTDYATVLFNRTPSTGASGGYAEELDFRNLNLSGKASVQVNGIVGAAGFPEATSDNFIALSAKIGAHELGHLLGLRHEDAIGPIGYGLHTPPGSADYKPSFTGPSAGYATFDHLIGSPATVGSDRFNDLRTLYFGEREAVKLAFNDWGTSIVESTSAKTNAASAQAITMRSLAVPNTLLSGFNAGKLFQVSALSVSGTISLDASGHSVSDWYSFTGSKGDLINLAVYSASLTRVSESIDSILRVYDSNGSLVPYYDGLAVNDDQFEPTDSSLTDLVLPADGGYYIEVDTFARPANDPLNDPLNPLSPFNPNYVPPGLTPAEITDAIRDRIQQLKDALKDKDTGTYELFLYRFATSTNDAVGDLLVGRAGRDITNAGPGEVSPMSLSLPTTVQTASEGQVWNASGSFADLSGFSWTATVDYGNGNGPQSLTLSANKSFSLQTIYTDNSSTARTVNIVVTNDDGVAVTGTVQVQVSNVAPIATLTNNGPITAGNAVVLTFSGAFDPSLVDTAVGLRYSFATTQDTLATSWGTAQSLPASSVILTTVGSIPVYGRIIDKDGGYTTYTTNVVVTGVVSNTPPSLVVRAPEGGVKGTLYNFQFTATDLDAVDANGPFEFKINWGDGTAVQTVTGGRTMTVQHRFVEVSSSGTFTIQAFVKDARGAQSLTRTVEFGVLGWSVLPDPTNPVKTVLVLVGSQEEDEISIKNLSNSDYLRIKIQSEECDVKYRGLVSNDVNRILVFGLGDEDSITIDDSVNIPVLVWGGDGDDRIKGGSGNDILIGGLGDDIIYGGSGRDLMIGGAGQDKLHGDAGDDILIAGYTSYDNNRIALEAIMAEWGNTTRSYEERRKNISNQSNATFVNRANGNYFFKFDGSTAASNTIFDDGVSDLLWGDAGLDWFLLNLDGDNNSCMDQAKDRSSTEVQNDIDRWW